MSLLTRFFGNHAQTVASSDKSAPTPAAGQWQCLLIPAVDQPYSNRALEVAYRLAQGTNAQIRLAYLIEVPRILPLDAALPDAEAVAANALSIAEKAAIPYKVNVQSVIHRTRKAHDPKRKWTCWSSAPAPTAPAACPAIWRGNCSSPRPAR
jgi:hypothetical protein